jgi:hypothetical protein
MASRETDLFNCTTIRCPWPSNLRWSWRILGQHAACADDPEMGEEDRNRARKFALEFVHRL